MSTLFWSARAREVVAVEDDDGWFVNMRARVPANVTLKHEPDLSRFPGAIAGEEAFDVVVVDGPARGRTRLKCCRAAVERLRTGGVVILDNSDWLPESSRLLRDSGLLEVDFTGFAPICGHVQTTSLYFHRAFNVPPSNGRQPQAGRGSRPTLWEQPALPVPGAVVTCGDETFRGVVDDVSFEKASPTGIRHFRAVSYLGGDDVRCVAILDVNQDRVLRTRHRPTGRRRTDKLAAEIWRLAAMPWTEFVAFIAGHESRRFLLES
jgi:methyltransferase family protein